MDIATVRAFFMWCTIVDAGLLVLSFLMLAFAGDWVYRMHGKWFPMSRETFNVVIYSYLGVFKILIIVLNLVPAIVLQIIA